ncbi:MAG: type IX secretion system protein PorQ [Balneola sp.]
MNKIRNISCLLILFFSSELALGQTNNSSIFRFLDITPSAKSAALGGNHVGLFDANYSLFYLNPAYLTPTSSKNISATFVNYLADSRIGFANGAYDIKNIGTLGIGIRYAGYGDMDELDENGTNIGSFNARDLSLTTGLSTMLSEKLSAGAAVDFIHSSYQNYNSSAITASGGIYYLDLESNFSAGLSFRNLGDQIDYYNGFREELPFDVSLGVSKKPENFPFHLHLTLRQLNDWDLRVPGEFEKPAFGDNLFRHVIFGGEAAFSENFKFRLGYNRMLHEQTKTSDSFDLAGVSLGVGLNIRGVAIDISRSSYSSIGGIVQISVSSQLN